MKPDGFCEHVRVSEWKFYFNTLWISSTFDSFSTITVGNNGSGKTEKIQTFLTVSAIKLLFLFPLLQQSNAEVGKDVLLS